MRISPRKMVFTSVLSAMCVILPMVFHILPGGGSVFLPMHIPVLLCGMLCGWPWGLCCGLVGPLLSSLLTQMPPAAVLPGMMVECGIYGCVSGFLMARLPGKRPVLRLYGSLIPAMVLGRVVSGIAKALIFSPGLSLQAWVTASFVTGLPGILAQLALLPAMLMLLSRAKVLPLYQKR